MWVNAHYGYHKKKMTLNLFKYEAHHTACLRKSVLKLTSDWFKNESHHVVYLNKECVKISSINNCWEIFDFFMDRHSDEYTRSRGIITCISYTKNYYKTSDIKQAFHLNFIVLKKDTLLYNIFCPSLLKISAIKKW